MTKQPKAPTMRELRALAREVWGAAACVREFSPSGVCDYWSVGASASGEFRHNASVDHPSRATARRMLHAALMAARGAR